MYDILWDSIFEQFYIPYPVEAPDLTEEDLEAIEERADLWYMESACNF